MEVTHFPQLAQRMCIAECGVPVRVDGDGDLVSSLRYANHSGAHSYEDAFIIKIEMTSDSVVLMFFPRSAAERIPDLRTWPMGVTKSSTKLLVIHD